MQSLLHALKALADETRLRLVNVLLLYELNVGELVEILEMGQPRISRHLKILNEAGLVTFRRDGLWVFYEAVHKGEFVSLLHAIRAHFGKDSLWLSDQAKAEELVHERSKATTRFFDSIAPDYDRITQDMLGNWDIKAELADRMPDCRVALDLGCGTGDLLGVLLEKARNVIGVDSSQNMLEIARRRYAAAEQRLSLRIGAIEHLPLRDNEADFVLLSMVLHHLSSPFDGIREIFRVLDRKGTFFLIDFERHNLETMRYHYGDRWLGFDKAEVETWVEDAGFTIDSQHQFATTNGLTILLLAARKH